ncbi:hypothetical protein OC861_006187 [Tilletia horrida]|nr:hypothetical protein OC861_006187 [Tilletia horrida]
MKAIQALKQLILLLNTRSELGFVLEDLDPTHLFINGKFIDFIRENLEQELEKNTYNLEIS